ncbi:hypothetical protein SGRIM128S_05480 [Streptomyces griseomycini]
MAMAPSARAAAVSPLAYVTRATSSTPSSYPAAVVSIRSPSGSRTATGANRCRTTRPTPSVSRTRSVTSWANGMKVALWTTKSAPSVLSICSSKERDIEALATDMPPTRASPTISAAAVAPVRRGLRRALRWLIRPTGPNSAGKAAPSTRITGRTSSGPAMTVAIRVRTTPSPSREAAADVSPEVTHPISAAAPSAPTTEPTTARTRSGRPTPATSASASAAIGDTPAARRAGRYAATKVTPTPTTYAVTGVAHPMTISVVFRFMPNTPMSRISPKASPMPAASPSVEPIRPSSTASVSTDRRTCRRSAPSARSRPSSRVRWAISMEKVLTIRKTPTRTAIPAKPSITYLITSRNPPSSSAAVRACSSAVSTS